MNFNQKHISAQQFSPGESVARVFISSKPWQYCLKMQLRALPTQDGDLVELLLSPDSITENISAKDLYHLLSTDGDFRIQLELDETVFDPDPFSAELKEKRIQDEGLVLFFKAIRRKKTEEDGKSDGHALVGEKPSSSTKPKARVVWI